MQAPPNPFVRKHYPLLTAWYYQQLSPAWNERKHSILAKRHELSLSPARAGELAAAQLTVEIEAEMGQLLRAMGQLRESNDTLIDFHDVLLTLPPYRKLLTDLSGTRTLLTDIDDLRATRERRG